MRRSHSGKRPSALGRSIISVFAGAVIVAGPAALAAPVIAVPTPSPSATPSEITTDTPAPSASAESPSPSPSASLGSTPTAPASAGYPASPTRTGAESAAPSTESDPTSPSQSEDSSQTPSPTPTPSAQVANQAPGTPTQVADPGVQVVPGDRQATISWPDFGPEKAYAVQLRSSDGTWRNQAVEIEDSGQPASDLDHRATLTGLTNKKKYQVRIVAAPTQRAANLAVDAAKVPTTDAKNGTKATLGQQAEPAEDGAVSTPPVVVVPLFVPAPGSTTSVVNVRVGGDRTGSSGVTNLAGVTLTLYLGGASGPTTPVGQAWSTCVSDPDGDCSFTVPNTQTGGANRNVQYWIRQTGAPAGWYTQGVLNTGGFTGPWTTQAYTFRTPQLQGGESYYSDRTSPVSEGSNTPFMLSTGNNFNASSGVWQVGRTNPIPLAECGADIALVLDLSGSVGSALPQLQTAARTFVNALVGTPSRVALFTFASNSPANSSNNQNRPLSAVSTQTGANVVNAWIDGTRVATSGEGQFTNWDRAFSQVANSGNHYDVTVVITDGNPTVYGQPVQSNNFGTRFRETENGVYSANAIKALGTRMVAFGVGNGIAGNPANLEAISGQLANSDYFQTTDYAAAGAQLRNLALGACVGSLTVVKQVVPPSAPPGTITGATAAGGWDFSASATGGVTVDPPTGTTAGATGAVNFALTFPGGTTTAPVTARETEKSGYSLVQVGGFNAVCTRLDTGAAIPVTNSGADGFIVTAAESYPVSCTVYNRAPNPAAALRVTKTWVIPGVGSVPDGQQPPGIAAQLTLNGQNAPWAAAVVGLQAGQQVQISENTEIDRGQCTLVSSRLTNSNGTTVDLPLPFSATLNAGDNTYGITNVLSCPTTLTLEKQLSDDGANPLSWNLNALAPAGALPGPSGASGATADVTPGALYALSESGGDPNYVQRLGVGFDPANQVPGSTVSWFCEQVDQAGEVIPGFSDGLNGGVQVPIGYHVRCRAINETAHVKLIKVVQGGTAAPADWTLTATPTGNPPPGVVPINVQGAAAADAVAVRVRPGQEYAVSESGPPGYSQASSDCVEANRGLQLTNMTFTPLGGDQWVCTFTNVRDTATLTLVKTVTNNNGGTAVPTDWTLSAAGPTPISGLSGEPEVTSQNVDTGTYTLSEADGPAGYTAGTWACDNGQTGGTVTVGISENVTCTINNDDQPALLTLVKTVTNDNGGTAVPTDWTLSAVGPTPITGVTEDPAVTAAEVSAGDYSLSEAGGPPGYTGGAWSCDNGDTGGSVSLALGEAVTCSINNDDQSAQLTLVKTVTNNNGGTAAPTDWTLSAAGPTPITGATGEPAITAALVNAGDYTLTEADGPAGYTPGSWACDNGDTGGTVTVALGEAVTCTINNDDQPAQLSLVKTVTNDDGGTAVPTDWTLSAAGPTAISGASGDPAITGAVVDAGDYTLTEAGGPAGYTAGAWSCDNGDAGGSVTLAPGGAVTCTINNDDQAAQLTLVKTVTNDNGGTAVPTDWTLSAAGPTPITGVTGDPVVTQALVSAGTYTLSEADGPAGYTAGAWSCDNGETGDAVTLAPGDDVTCTIDNDDQTAHLTLVKTVTNDNGGTALPTDWTLSAAGPTQITGVTEAPAITGAEVDAGDYTLTEADGPTGYTAGMWSCDNGDTGGTVTLALGEDVTCTINNDDQPAQLTLVKQVAGPPELATADPTEWTLSAAGPTPITGATGDPAITAAAVSAGAYTLTEAVGPAGYDAGAWSCDNGDTGGTVTIALGDDVTCTIVNTLASRTMTLEKVWVNGLAPDTAELMIDGVNDDSTVSDAPDAPSGANSATVTIYAGEPVDLSEVLTTDPTRSYTPTLVCDQPGLTWAADATTGTYTAPTDLAAFQDVTCTFTNTRDTAQLTLVKQVAGPAELATADPTEWTLSAAGPTPITGMTADPAVTDALVGVGDYTLTEAGGPEGYDAGAWSCDNGDTGGTVTLAVGDDVTCTIVNTLASRTMTLRKVWVDGLAPDSAELAIDGVNDGTATSNAPDAPAAGNSATVTIYAGEVVDLSEALTVDPSRSYTSQLECDQPGLAWQAGATNGTFTAATDLTAFQNVTCTFTNTRDTAHLTLVKTVDGPPELATADPTDWTLSAAGASPISGATGDPAVTGALVGIGEYTLTEASGPAGYEAGAWSCDNGDAGGTVTLAIGDDVTCTIVNTLASRTMTLEKVWVDGLAPDSAELTIDGLDTGTATSIAPDGPTATNSASVTVYAGEAVTLTEVLTTDPGRDYETTLVCDQPGLDWQDGATTGTFTAPTDVAAFLDVSCTFTNSRGQHAVTLSKIWEDGVGQDTATLRISGGMPDPAEAVSTANGQPGLWPDDDPEHVAATAALDGETITVDEDWGADNVGEYSATFSCVTAGGASVTLTDGSFAMPPDDVRCTVTNARVVVPPGRPDVTPETCTVGNPPDLIAGTIIIPENADYVFTVNGTPYPPGTYSFDAGTYVITATLVRSAPAAVSRAVTPLAQAQYEWTVTIEPPTDCSEMDKLADPPSGSQVAQGDVISYEIVVGNIGTDPVADQTIVDTLPEGVELIESSVDPAADYDPGAGTLTWTIDLPAGSVESPSAVVLSYQVKVSVDDGTLVNTAQWVQRDLTVQTSHPVSPNLPHTGAGNVTDAAVAGVLLLGGGAFVAVGVRRRRREELSRG